MTSALLVRDFVPSDLDAVLALNMHAQDPEADIPSSLRHYPALLDIPANFQRDGAFIVGTLDDSVVAMGAVTPQGDAVFEMDYIRVSIPHHRTGHGRSIVQHLEGRVSALGGDAVILTTGADNIPAQRLYETGGYVEARRGTVYNLDGKAFSTVHYRKELARPGA